MCGLAYVIRLHASASSHAEDLEWDGGFPAGLFDSTPLLAVFDISLSSSLATSGLTTLPAGLFQNTPNLQLVCVLA